MLKRYLMFKQLLNATLLCLGVVFSAWAQEDSMFPDLDFEKANGIDVVREMGFKFTERQEKQVALMRALYDKNKPSQLEASAEPRFAKIIHQIWIGPNPVPKSYQYYAKLWQDMHPDWEYKLWTDKDVEGWDFPNKDLYYKARSYAERSDILRMEALNKYGGIYVDMDAMPLQPLDELVYKYDYFFVTEPIAMSKNEVRVANNIIGGKAGHPATQAVFKYMRQNWDARERHHDEKNAVTLFGNFKRSPHNLAVHRTMLPVTDAFFEIAEQLPDGVGVFPAAFFGPYYPKISGPIRNKLSLWVKGYGHFNGRLEIHPYTKALHLWYKELSFMPKYDFFTAMFGGAEYKGGIFRYLTGVRKERFVFENLYEKNHPTVVDWSPQDKMPKLQHVVCHADVCSQAGVLPSYEVISWNKGLQEEPEEIKPILQRLIDTQLKEFLIAVHAIKNNGGVYVSRRLAPHFDIAEISNKYNFFAALQTISSLRGDFKVSTDIIAASKDHSILRNFLVELQEIAQTTEGTLDDYVQDILTQSAYKFNLLDGKTLLLPEFYFD
jgi:hypothetical protein